MHLKGLQSTLTFFIGGELVYEHESITKLGKYWEGLSLKNRWGGSWRGLVESGKSTFKDTPHFERTNLIKGNNYVHVTNHVIYYKFGIDSTSTGLPL